MPGEFWGNGELGIEKDAMQNRTAVKDGEIETDVPEVKANGEKDGIPVFDVSREDFYNNMKIDRRRIRFVTDTVRDYMQKTKYNRPFYIRSSDGYLRKIK